MGVDKEYTPYQRHMAYPMLVEIRGNKLYGTFPDIEGITAIAFTQEDLIHSAMDELLEYILNTDIKDRKKPSDIIFFKREEFNYTKYSAVLLVPVVPEILYDPKIEAQRCFVDRGQVTVTTNQDVDKMLNDARLIIGDESDDMIYDTSVYIRNTQSTRREQSNLDDNVSSIIRAIAKDGPMTGTKNSHGRCVVEDRKDHSCISVPDNVIQFGTPTRREVEDLDKQLRQSRELITLPEKDDPMWSLLRELIDME